MYEFKMPALGSEMTHGTLLEWKVKKGDKIKRHDIIAVVDTDKAAIEVESFGEGVVEKFLVQPGEKVPVGTAMALIHDEGAAEPTPPTESRPQKIRISPLARKLASEMGVDISAIKGSGPDGAIIEEDIKTLARPSPAAKSGHALSMKKAIAAAMSRSKREIPHYYLSCSIGFKNVLDWLEKYNSERPVPERIVYAAFLIRAVVKALEKFPEFNGFYVNDEFQQASSVHAGFAISLRGGGLIAPALVDANTMKLAEVMNALTDLVARARTGKLKGREMSDSTVTITNLGESGVDSVFGVIYPPQVALIGFGAVSPQKVMTATLSADHRVSNGLLGSRFLSEIKNLLENPEKLV